MRSSQEVQWDARKLVTILARLLTCSGTLPAALDADQVDNLKMVGLGAEEWLRAQGICEFSERPSLPGLRGQEI